MALDDRDRTLDKALARYFGSPSESASSSAPACPDAEILAAYHDATLSAGELAFWKPHVLACENCQVILQHLAAPLEVSHASGVRESVAEPVPVPASQPATAPAKISSPPRRGRLTFLWLAPAGALAAGLIAWIAIQTPKPASIAPSPAIEVAENRQATAAPPQSQPASPAAAYKAKKDEAANALPKVLSRDSDALHKENSLDSARPMQQAPARAKNSPAASLGVRSQNKKSENPAFDDSFDQEKQKQVLEAWRVEAQQEDKRRSAQRQQALNADAAAIEADMKKQGIAQQAQATPPSPGEAGFVAGGAVPVPAAPKSASAASSAPPKPAAEPKDGRTDSKLAIGALTESVEVSTASQSVSQLRAALLQNPHIFAAPRGKVFWRIGAAGSLERSTDSGKTWTPQVSGVFTDLRAGSAPTAKISWIVGDTGAILRTTDAGAHWTKLASPTSADIIGVRASDALHASVWTAPDPRSGVAQTFETSDGGLTWSSAPAE